MNKFIKKNRNAAGRVRTTISDPTMLGAKKRGGKEMDQWWVGEGHWEENKGILGVLEFPRREPRDGGACGLPSMGLHRVGHD